MSFDGRCVIISGMSGAGKSTALRSLEDRGFFACDNLLPSLLVGLIEQLSDQRKSHTTGAAVVVDSRSEDLVSGLLKAVKQIRDSGVATTLVFLDATDGTLVRRYETTRRRHPLAGRGTILECISDERRIVAPLKDQSDIIKDTTSMMPADLTNELMSDLGIGEGPLTVTVSSFGFKYGAPRDSDYIFDVRFLPNPNYVPELKLLSGKDAQVQEYLDRVPEKLSFVNRTGELMSFVLRHYGRSGKKHVHIAFGCTGGRHRSVAVAVAVADLLSSSGCDVSIRHRDIAKDDQGR